LVVPQGRHSIEFRFEPESYYIGNKIAYAGSFTLFAFVLSTLGFAGYKKFKMMQAEPAVEINKIPEGKTSPKRATKK
jgi:hypothetical protein